MKKSIILLALAVMVCSQSFAQVKGYCSINELEKLYNLELDEYEDMLLNNGFSFMYREHKEGIFELMYYSDKPGAFEAFNQMLYYVENSRKIISFTTPSKDYYLKLKNSMKTLGYKYYSMDEWDINDKTKSNFTHYRKNKNQLTIYYYKGKSGITFYSFNFKRIQ